MPKTGIEINGQTVYPDTEIKIDIPDILQYLKDNGGVKRFPRIVILAGELAGRCISYVSRDYVWHLTDMYYVPSASTTMPTMMQAIGRLCGRNKGKATLKLYMPEKIMVKILRGMSFYKELVERVNSDCIIDTMGHETKMCVALENIPIRKSKVSSIKLTNKVKSPKIKVVKDTEDDGGWSFEKYNDKTSERYTGFDQPESEIEDSEDEIQKDDGLEENEYIRLTTKMFPKWSKDSTAIAKFMQNLDPKKKYTKSEFKEECKKCGVHVISQLLKSPKDQKDTCTKTHSKGFGKIICYKNDKYYLYPSLVSSFTKYF
jgi:hypothetical protein